jgi:hypothetical protein
MNGAGRGALAALERLHEATPAPPAAGAEPDEVVARAREVLAAREQPLADLMAALERDPEALRGLPGAAALIQTIQERAAAWHAALSHARHVVGERIQASARLQRLARR